MIATPSCWALLSVRVGITRFLGSLRIQGRSRLPKGCCLEDLPQCAHQLAVGSIELLAGIGLSWINGFDPLTPGQAWQNSVEVVAISKTPGS